MVSGTIYLRRVKSLSDSLRAYRVFIDGIERGLIENGHVFRINVESGMHLIHLKCDWKKTPQIEFTIHGGETVEFECGVNVGILKKILIVFDFFNGSTWFYLRRKLGASR